MRTVVVTLVVLLAALVAAPRAGEPLYPQGTGWQFVELELRELVRAQGLGKVKTTALADGALGFGLETFALDLDLDATPDVDGAWSRKSPGSRRLDLAPDGPSAAGWLARATEQVAAFAAAEGVPDAEVALSWHKTSWRARLQAKGASGEAAVVLVIRLKATGTISGSDGSVRKAAFTARLRGASQPQPVGVLHVGPGTSGEPPAASFLVGATSGSAPFGTQFLDTSSGAITSLSWDFGDGAVSQEPEPLHTYTLPGDYTVRLTATGPEGSDTAETIISVSGSGPQSLVLFPGLVADLTDPDELSPVMLAQQGPHQLWFTGFSGGLEQAFPFTYPAASNGSRHYAFELALGTNTFHGEYVTQTAEVSLRLVRARGGSTTVAGPVAFEVSGEVYELPTVGWSTDDGPLLGAEPGDRLELVIRNASPPEPGSTHYLEVLLGPCRVESPGI